MYISKNLRRLEKNSGSDPFGNNENKNLKDFKIGARKICDKTRITIYTII